MQILRPVVTFALALMLAATSPAYSRTALPATGGIVAGPSIEGISEYTLANGLRVLLFPDATKPTVTVNIVYNVGSVNENYGETGMAHLLEHLQFKGTPTHSDIRGEMVKRGIESKGTTSLERTDFHNSFPADDDTLTWVLEMEADRMVNSNIAQKDLDSEMTVVRNEMEIGENDPQSVLYARIVSTAFLWHNYGKSPIGARSDVESVPIERLQAFYRQWYQPDTATLIVAGRIDPERTLQLIGERFGRIAKPTGTLPRSYTVEPAQDGEREVILRRVSTANFTAVAYHIPAITHADHAALSVLGDLLGYTPGGRLHKALVESKLAVYTGAYTQSMRDSGLFITYVTASSDGVATNAQAELLKQVEKLAERPVTQVEVDKSRQRIANSFDLNFTDVNAVAMGLSEYLAAGDWRLLFATRDAIDKVTAADVNRVAAAYLKPSNRTLGHLVPTENPDQAEIPAAPDAAKVVEGYKGRATVTAGENFDPSPQNLHARTQTFLLGDGLKVSLLPRKTRGETVVVEARFRFGDEASLTGRQGAAEMTGAMLMHGSRSMSRQQIDQRFEALKTQADISGNTQSAVIGLRTRRSQLADALALAADVLRNPAFPESEFEQLRRQPLTDMESSSMQPETIAGMALAQHFDPWPVGHPLHVQTLDKSLIARQALKREELVAFHHDFYGTAEGEIAIVGDFDSITMKKQLEALFVGWKSPRPFVPIDRRYTVVAAKRERFETPDKPNAVILARQNLPLSMIDEDLPTLMVANNIFGGSGLKSRLVGRIREKEGLSYGVDSMIGITVARDHKTNAGYLGIQATAAPQNMDNVEAAIREEMTRLVKDGITAEELRDGVSSILSGQQQDRAEDGGVAKTLAMLLHSDLDLTFVAQMDARVQALTLEQVNAAIRKYLKPEELSVFIAGDFAKAPQAAAAAGE